MTEIVFWVILILGLVILSPIIVVFWLWIIGKAGGDWPMFTGAALAGVTYWHLTQKDEKRKR